MMSAAAALIAYGLFILSDVTNLKLKGKGLLPSGLFIGGSAVLVISFFRIIFSALFSGIVRISFIPVILFILFLILLLYSVFPGLMREADEKTSEDGLQPLVSHGIYALCRHPGVLWMAGCCICLYYICPARDMAILSLLSVVLDILYVIWQDAFLFPKIISGYKKYKEKTPFLIPTFSSLVLCLNYVFKR